MDWGELILAGSAIYVTLGFGVALFMGVGGLRRIDQATRGAGFGFRSLVMPGIVALWPLLLLRLLRRQSDPPEERNNHRRFQSEAAP